MGSWSDFGQGRLTGRIIGNFFYLTKHSDLEFHYGKIYATKSRAIGFVTDAGDETQVWALSFYGDIGLHTMIKNFILFMMIFAIVPLIETRSLSVLATPLIYLYATVSTLVIGVGTGITAWFTEQGHQNMLELRSMLENPMRFWADTEESE